MSVWIEQYVDAWRTPGTDKLAEIFAEEASYRVSPWKEPMEGLDEIRPFWEGSRTSADETFELQHEIVAVEGDTAVARIDVNYLEGPTKQWKDIWIMRFAPDGRCSHFEEWPFAPDQDDGQK